MSSAGTPVTCSAASGRVAGDDLAHVLDALGVLGDVRVVLQAFLEDHVQHRVDQPDVAARPQLQVALGDLRQPDLARVGDDERRALAHRLLHPQREHRVRLGRVRADHEQEAAVLDLRDRVGACPSAQRPDQAVKSRRVSGGFAGVDRVGPDHPPRQLLQQVVLLVRQPRRGEDADRLRAMSLADAGQSLCRGPESGVPVGRVQARRRRRARAAASAGPGGGRS